MIVCFYIFGNSFDSGKNHVWVWWLGVHILLTIKCVFSGKDFLSGLNRWWKVLRVGVYLWYLSFSFLLTRVLPVSRMTLKTCWTTQKTLKLSWLHRCDSLLSGWCNRTVKDKFSSVQSSLVIGCKQILVTCVFCSAQLDKSVSVIVMENS